MIFLQRWRVRLGHLFALVLIFTARPSTSSLLIGGALAILGEGFRVLSAGYIEKDSAVMRSGPYAHVRNPLYVGSFVMYLGMALAANRLPVIIAYFPFFFFVYFATILREESFLSNKFKDEYANYQKRVPRFLPRILPAKLGGDGVFSWSQVRHNREYEGVIGAVISLAILAAFALFHFSPLDLLLKH